MSYVLSYVLSFYMFSFPSLFPSHFHPCLPSLLLLFSTSLSFFLLFSLSHSCLSFNFSSFSFPSLTSSLSFSTFCFPSLIPVFLLSSLSSFLRFLALIKNIPHSLWTVIPNLFVWDPKYMPFSWIFKYCVDCLQSDVLFIFGWKSCGQKLSAGVCG